MPTPLSLMTCGNQPSHVVADLQTQGQGEWLVENDQTSADRVQIVAPRAACAMANLHAFGAFSTAVTEAAPRLRHSNETMPVPENRSRTCIPDKSTREESKLNRPSRPKSVVGLPRKPFNSGILLPRQSPPVIRMPSSIEKVATKTCARQHWNWHLPAGVRQCGHP